ncbi:hypothetical protein [Dyadobacter sp. 676]|uniref:Uncharacterized protein n=1 Tax=Dyadobacter sp. 676 TaxID=3088362 RepID=A0AAU8FSW1_9BACT
MSVLLTVVFIYTPITDESPDLSRLVRYGQLVQDLLSQTSPDEWIDDPLVHL